MIIDDQGSEIVPTAIAPRDLAPASALSLDHFTVFEDTVKFVSQTDGAAKVVDGYCGRVGDISDGTVFVVIVLNRLLFPLPLHHVGEWAGKVGLHLLLGIPDVGLLNYDRLVDTLAALQFWVRAAVLLDEDR